MKTAEIRRRFIDFFARNDHTIVPSRVAALQRPHAAVRQRGHGPVQAVLHRRRARPVQARCQRAEVRAHPRHRGGRQDHPPRHLLPDERQLRVRRLLQAGSHRVRLGAGDRLRRRRELRVRPRQDLGHRATSTTTRRSRTGRPSASRRSTSSAAVSRTTTGTWASPDRVDPARRSTSTAGRSSAPTAAPRPTRTATWRSGTSCSRPRSCRLSARRTTSTCCVRCRPRTSTPVWASSARRTCCRARATCTRSTRSSPSSSVPRRSRASRTGPIPATTCGSASSATTSARRSC